MGFGFLTLSASTSSEVLSQWAPRSCSIRSRNHHNFSTSQGENRSDRDSPNCESSAPRTVSRYRSPYPESPLNQQRVFLSPRRISSIPYWVRPLSEHSSHRSRPLRESC